MANTGKLFWLWIGFQAHIPTQNHVAQLVKGLLNGREMVNILFLLHSSSSMQIHSLLFEGLLSHQLRVSLPSAVIADNAGQERPYADQFCLPPLLVVAPSKTLAACMHTPLL